MKVKKVNKLKEFKILINQQNTKTRLEIVKFKRPITSIIRNENNVNTIPSMKKRNTTIRIHDNYQNFNTTGNFNTNEDINSSISSILHQKSQIGFGSSFKKDKMHEKKTIFNSFLFKKISYSKFFNL